MTKPALVVSVIQMPSENGAVAANLARAEAHIASAASLGASLILLPELALNGFELTEGWWSTATPHDGRIVCWLSEQARVHRAYIGTTFLEADGDHFFNTFALASPDGRIGGLVRKNPPASFEAYFYRAGQGSHIIETSIGRIGVGICFENLMYERLEEFHEAKVDLVLQPMCAPLPERSFPFRQRDVDRYASNLAQLPMVYARGLGVPVLTANKCGSFRSALPAIRKEYRSSFPGLSAIVDSDGASQRLKDQEQILVGRATLDPDRKATVPPPRFGKWTLRRAWFAPLFDWTRRKGERAYAANPRRASAARRATVAIQGDPHRVSAI